MSCAKSKSIISGLRTYPEHYADTAAMFTTVFTPTIDPSGRHCAGAGGWYSQQNPAAEPAARIFQSGLLGESKSQCRSVAMFLASVLVLLLASLYAADARSGGAPADACANLTPQHGGNQPQGGASPYTLNLATVFDVNGTLQYSPGQTYTSMLIGTFDS